MTREPFNFNPHGYTPNDVARWLLDRLRCFGVVPRDLLVTDLMGCGEVFLTREQDGRPCLLFARLQ
jgi:hypothetical protein